MIPKESDERAANRHILVVEDDAVSRQLFTTTLTRAGFRVTAASDGEKGLAMLSRFALEGPQVDLVMTDIMMPNLSGIDLMDEMKRLEINIPVFAVTAFGEKEVVVELLRRGCVEFIEKPVDVKDMIERIRTFFRQRDRVLAEKNRQKQENKRLGDVETCRMARMRAEFDAAMTAYHSLVRAPEAECKVKTACFNRPLAGMGGDFAGIQDTGTGCDILVADVSGHDMGAAFHTVLIQTLFSENVAANRPPETFFCRLNQKLLENNGDDRMATALFLRLNLEKGDAEAVCAGHPPFIHLHPSGRISQPQDLRGDILGVFETVSFFPKRFFPSPGDRFLLFTDGVEGVDRFNQAAGRREVLGAEGIRRLVVAHRRLPLNEMVDAIGKSVLEYSGYAVKDDILLVGVEIPDDV